MTSCVGQRTERRFRRLVEMKRPSELPYAHSTAFSERLRPVLQARDERGLLLAPLAFMFWHRLQNLENNWGERAGNRDTGSLIE
jgi:hypothetical protein